MAHERLDKAVKSVLAPCSERDARALRRQQLGGDGTDAAAGTCDEDDLAFMPSFISSNSSGQATAAESSANAVRSARFPTAAA